jgi:hypothetical protein
MREFFSTKIGHQTIATLVTILSFPFLYVGGTQHINAVLILGIVLMLSGMLAVPAMGFIHSKKTTEKEVNKKLPSTKLSGSKG